MDKLHDYTLIDVLHDLLVEIRNMNSRLDEIEKKLIAVNTENKTYESKRVLNFSEAAEYLSISKSALYKHTSVGEIPFSKPSGKRIYFQKEKVELRLLQNPRKSRQEIEQEVRNFTLRSGRRKN